MDRQRVDQCSPGHSLLENLVRLEQHQKVPLKEWEGIMLAYNSWPITAMSGFHKWASYNLAPDRKTICYVGVEGHHWQKCHRDAMRTKETPVTVDPSRESIP